MTVGFLTNMLTCDTAIKIIDRESGKTLFEGKANEAKFDDKVKDWDFSRGHILYI